MVARDQFVGKWQVPTSNYAMSLRSFDDVCGEVISIGERPALSIHNAAASMRMAVAEAVNNMMSVPIESISCLLYTSPSPRDGLLSRMPSSA